MSGRNEKSAPRFGATAGRVPFESLRALSMVEGLVPAVAVALAAMVLVSAAAAQETASEAVGKIFIVEPSGKCIPCDTQRAKGSEGLQVLAARHVDDKRKETKP